MSPPGPPRSRLSWVIGPLLGLASLLLLAGGAELVLRVLHARDVAQLGETRPERERCTEADPLLVYRYIPGRCGHNARGYRDIDHGSKPDGSFRIVVIGDSVAVGDGIEVEDRFDRVLVDRLNARGVAAEAVNLARTGYSTSQELRVLEGEGYDYDPDLVVWSYVLNDPADPVHHNANGRLGRYFWRPRSQVVHGLSRLVFKLRERIAGFACPDEYHAFLHCVYRDAIAADLAKLGSLSRSRGVPTLFVIHPVFEQSLDFTSYSLRNVHDWLRATAEANGLTVVDLLDAYRDEKVPSLQQPSGGWFDPWHPTARGHGIAAEELERAIVAARQVAGFAAPD